jgi:hypothetical protein
VNPWEIWTYDFPGIGPHPAVVVSGPERAERKIMLEVLRCGSARAGRAAGFGEVVLNSADGLDWETLCFCDCVWSAPRAEVNRRRGVVTPERRRSIVSAILQSHGWIGI